MPGISDSLVMANKLKSNSDEKDLMECQHVLDMEASPFQGTCMQLRCAPEPAPGQPDGCGKSALTTVILATLIMDYSNVLNTCL